MPGYNPIIAGFQQGQQAGWAGLDMAQQQERMAAEQKQRRAQMFMQLASQLRTINQLEPELQGPMYDLLDESYTRAMGESFPKPLLEAFKKGSAEQGEKLLQAVGVLAEQTQFDPRLLSRVLREQPGALANIMVQAAQMRQAAQEQAYVQSIAAGGAGQPAGASSAAPQAGGVGGRLAEIESKIGRIMGSGRTGAAIEKYLGNLQQERAALLQQQHQASQLGMEQQRLGLEQGRYNLQRQRQVWEMDPARRQEELQMRLQASREQGLAAASMKPLEAGERERLVALDRAGQITQTLATEFTPEERAQYVGMGGMRFRGQQLQQLLADVQGGQANPRFAYFAALVNEAQAEAFRTGGKQLTEQEAAIVFGYVPTGKELSAEQFEQKLSEARNRIIGITKNEIKLLTTPRSRVGEVIGPDAPRQEPLYQMPPAAAPMAPPAAPPVVPPQPAPSVQKPRVGHTLGEVFGGAAESLKSVLPSSKPSPANDPSKLSDEELMRRLREGK